MELRLGSRGESIRDLQQRLGALGFESDGDGSACFGPATEAAVRAFQSDRGLRCDGVCGQQTWSALVEAGRVLGERFLYYKLPMLRGDDVAALQRQLGLLGFDAGRVDGIFGPRTRQALGDFQLNAGLTVDWIVGPETLKLLSRVGARSSGLGVVSDIRERQRLRETPRTLHGRRIVVGEAGGLGALVDGIRRVLARAGSSVVTLHDPDESIQASQTNRLEGEVYVGMRLEPDRPGCSTAYFLGYRGIGSEGGRRLAEIIQAVVPVALSIPDRGAVGMRLPVLRETRMPAVLVELGPPQVVVEHAPDVAHAVARALATWVSSPYDEPDRPPAEEG